MKLKFIKSFTNYKLNETSTKSTSKAKVLNESDVTIEDILLPINGVEDVKASPSGFAVQVNRRDLLNKIPQIFDGGEFKGRQVEVFM